MCGIIGVVEPAAEGRKANLEKACALMRHRGPDDTGLWSAKGAMLGLRRLAILDLSAAGHQPMLSRDGRLALVFNGEIYNHRELRRELEITYPFRSQTDSEVLLAGFTAWGWEGLLRRIDGMFAFAIWDDRSQTLYAARDRVGKKPFFYALTPNGLIFASTLNALNEQEICLPEVPVEPRGAVPHTHVDDRPGPESQPFYVFEDVALRPSPGLRPDDVIPNRT